MSVTTPKDILTAQLKPESHDWSVVGAVSGMAIINKTSETIYEYLPDGTTVPYPGTGTIAGLHASIIVNLFSNVVVTNSSVSAPFLQTSINIMDILHRPVKVGSHILVTASSMYMLEKTRYSPTYSTASMQSAIMTELSGNNYTRIENMQPVQLDRFVKDIDELSECIWSKIASKVNSKLAAHCNIHNPEIDKLYVSINEYIIDVRPSHDVTSDETFVIGYGSDEKTLNTFDIAAVQEEFTKGCVTVKEDEDTKILISTDLSKIKEESNKVSIELAKANAEVADLKNQLDELKKNIGASEKMLEETKKSKKIQETELENIKAELTAVASGAVKSADEKSADMKLREAELRLKTTEVKADTEERLAASKERTAAYSVSSDSVNTIATTVKASAVIIPAAIAVGAAFTKAMASSSELAAVVGAGLGACAPMAVPLVAAAACTVIFKVVKKSAGVIHDVTESLFEKVSDAYECVKNRISSVWDSFCGIFT